ncbi:MAG: hypothetical protein ACK4VW_09255 [Anaerolineales bacterium]
MNSLSPLFVLDSPCNSALQWTKASLAQVGLRVLQTFDLQSARHAPQECPCPHHGTENCDCQMVILLVYGEHNKPATLLLHGNKDRTWISLVEDVHQDVASRLGQEVREALGKRLASSHLANV